VLGPYLTIIDQWLEGDKNRPRKPRHTATRVYDRLVREHGFTGGRSTVQPYVRAAKARLGLQGTQAFIPLDPEVSREAEVDWGPALAIIAGKPTTVKFFGMRSRYSGKHLVRAYPCERQQAFWDGHLHAFVFFGGVFPTLVYDNLTAAVKKVLQAQLQQVKALLKSGHDRLPLPAADQGLAISPSHANLRGAPCYR